MDKSQIQTLTSRFRDDNNSDTKKQPGSRREHTNGFTDDSSGR